VLEAAGVRDILTKSMGSANVLNVVYATLRALESLKSPEIEARQRGKELKDVTPFWNRKKNGQPQP
jgi:small subunit ribosomal protein S5